MRIVFVEQDAQATAHCICDVVQAILSGLLFACVLTYGHPHPPPTHTHSLTHPPTHPNCSLGSSLCVCARVLCVWVCVRACVHECCFSLWCNLCICISVPVCRGVTLWGGQEGVSVMHTYTNVLFVFVRVRTHTHSLTHSLTQVVQKLSKNAEVTKLRTRTKRQGPHIWCTSTHN